MSTKRQSGGAWVEVEVEAFELASEVELESEVPVAVLESEVELEIVHDATVAVQKTMVVQLVSAAADLMELTFAADKQTSAECLQVLILQLYLPPNSSSSISYSVSPAADCSSMQNSSDNSSISDSVMAVLYI